MADVLILVLMFPPDSVSTAQIFGDLARDLQARGHRVTVLSTVPHYNPDPAAEARQPMRRRWGGLLRTSDYHGVSVYHVWMPKKGGSVVGRLLSWAWFHLSTIVAGLTVIRRPDVVLTPSPPLTNGVAAWVLGAIHRAPYVYNVQEIYPDIAINLGVLRNRVLICLLLALERFVYDRAAAVTVIAPRMRDRLLAKRADPTRIHVIPNFVDGTDITPMPKDNAWSRRHGVHEAFVASYAGNFGPAQGLDTLVEAARLLQKEGGIRFLLIGNGTLWPTIARRVEELALQNVSVVPQQPYALVPQIYGASDVCVVPQSAETGCDAIPSKAYRIMAAGRPILACTDPDSDLAHLVKDADCGLAVAANSPSALAAAVRDAFHNRARWRAMGEAGRIHVMEHYARPAVTFRYHGLVMALTGHVGNRGTILSGHP
jgi:colanic acid biosynthesis glycosyl transferase WcaI